MAVKKYLSLERLTEYDGLIKQEIAEGDELVKSYVDTEVAKKANSSHTHDDRYYTETEVDTKITGVNSTISTHTGNSDIHVTTTNKSNWNSAYTHSTSAHAPSNAEKNIIVGIQKNGTDLTVDSTTRKVNITVPTTAAEIGAASSTHNHDSAYDTKGSASSALASAKEYADSAATTAVNTVKNDLLNGAGSAYDTLKELGDLIDDNKDAIDALEEIASGKADATHTHAISDVTNLQTTLDGKAAASHTHTVSQISDLTATAAEINKLDGLTATTTELNYVDGVTSNIQTQLDGKAASSHSHTITATATDDDVIVLTGTNGSNKVTFDAKHATSGVTAGTYKSVTVNAYGHVTGGSNPTTISGYGITDAYTKAQVDSAISAAKTTVDSSLSSSSTNPVQNKVVNSAISTLTSTVSTNTSSISAHSTAISNLQTAIDSIQEITSEEISALFA